MSPGDWLQLGVVLFGYLVASAVAFFSLRQRVALNEAKVMMLEEFFKRLEAKLDKFLEK
jgi:hypothetical protein